MLKRTTKRKKLPWPWPVWVSCPLRVAPWTSPAKSPAATSPTMPHASHEDRTRCEAQVVIGHTPKLEHSPRRAIRPPRLPMHRYLLDRNEWGRDQGAPATSTLLNAPPRRSLYHARAS